LRRFRRSFIIGAMQKITTFLWFDDNAEDAVEFYLSVFREGKVISKAHYPEGGPEHLPAGKVMTIAFELNGQQFVALNGGPEERFNNAVSLVVNCDSQEEIDYYWEKLAANGGEHVACGWLKDRFGLRWQIQPKQIWEWLNGDDPARVQRVTAKVWSANKMNLAELERAAKG
jgi:predicted 3-demethylubiquinone-9 3-methyltransferase (glyoxalase superfamily)